MQMQNGYSGKNGVERRANKIERLSVNATRWIGSVPSLIVHTIIFSGAFALIYAGFDFDRVLLALTTIVSLEAIYLAIFIQMTINRTTRELEEISEDIEEIQEDVEDIQEDVEEITVADELEEETDDRKIEKIEQSLLSIVREVDALKSKAN